MSIEELKACSSSQMGNKGHGSRVPGKDGEEVGLLRLCVFGGMGLGEQPVVLMNNS